MKKIEFSKIITVFAVIVMLIVAIWSIINYYTLAKLAIESNASVLPDSSIPIACITTILGAILSYCLYQFGLKNSRNKYGIDAYGSPFKSRVEFNSVLEDINEKVIEHLSETTESEEYPEQNPRDCEYIG